MATAGTIPIGLAILIAGLAPSWLAPTVALFIGGLGYVALIDRFGQRAVAQTGGVLVLLASPFLPRRVAPHTPK